MYDVLIYPVRRSFDGRVVLMWKIVDEGGLRDSGCELTREAAKRAASRSHWFKGFPL